MTEEKLCRTSHYIPWGAPRVAVSVSIMGNAELARFIKQLPGRSLHCEDTLRFVINKPSLGGNVKIVKHPDDQPTVPSMGLASMDDPCFSQLFR